MSKIQECTHCNRNAVMLDTNSKEYYCGPCADIEGFYPDGEFGIIALEKSPDWTVHLHPSSKETCDFCEETAKFVYTAEIEAMMMCEECATAKKLNPQTVTTKKKRKKKKKKKKRKKTKKKEKTKTARPCKRRRKIIKDEEIIEPPSTPSRPVTPPPESDDSDFEEKFFDYFGVKPAF